MVCTALLTGVIGVHLAYAETALREGNRSDAFRALVLLGERSAPTESRGADPAAAERGFQRLLVKACTMDGEELVTPLGDVLVGLGRDIARAASLFMQLRYGVRSALRVIDELLSSEHDGTPGFDAAREMLLLEKVDLALGADELSPREVKEVLSESLEVAPTSPSMLARLFDFAHALPTSTWLRFQLTWLLRRSPSAASLFASRLKLEICSQPGIRITDGQAANVRGVFEQAVEALPTCPALWRSWILVESAEGRIEMAMRVFRRAIGSCSWCKMLWADGFALGLVHGRDARELMDAMEDKDVRIRAVCSPGNGCLMPFSVGPALSANVATNLG